MQQKRHIKGLETSLPVRAVTVNAPKHPTTENVRLLMSWLRKFSEECPVVVAAWESPRARPGGGPVDGILLGALTRETQAPLDLVSPPVHGVPERPSTAPFSLSRCVLTPTPPTSHPSFARTETHRPKARTQSPSAAMVVAADSWGAHGT